MQNKVGFVLFVAFILVLASVVAVSASTPGPISSCQTLDTPGTYTLNQSINATGNCFTITSNDVVLNGNGHSIIGDSNLDNNGIYAENLDNLTIENFFLISGFGNAVYLDNSNNSTIFNISTDHNSMGVYLEDSSHNNLKNINSSASFNGIYLFYSDLNTLSNINSVSSSDATIYLLYSDSNNLKNIKSSNIGEEKSIALIDSNNNNFENVFSNSNIENSVLLFSSSYNSFMNLVSHSELADDLFLGSLSVNNSFINATYNISQESVDSNSQLIREWYLNANVKDQNNNNLQNASVSAYNASGMLQFSQLTDSNGNIPTQTLIQYVNNGGTRTDYNNYTINATKSGYSSNSAQINLTQSSALSFNIAASSSNLLSSCAEINQPGVYTVQNSFNTTSEMCFKINADNVTLNGQNFPIYEKTLKPSTIGIFTSGDRKFVNIINMNMTNFGQGMVFYSINYSNVSNNSLDSCDSVGMTVFGYQNVIKNNNIKGCGSPEDAGLSTGGGNNYFFGNVINNIGADAIDIGSDQNSLFEGNIFYSKVAYDVYLTASAPNETFLNDTFVKEKVNSGSQLIREWYLNANVKDQNNNNLQNANVLAYNASGILQFSQLTDSNGNIPTQTVVEYVNNGGTRTYASPYKISALKTGYNLNTTVLNISGNINALLTLVSLTNQSNSALGVRITAPNENRNFYATSRKVTFTFKVNDTQPSVVTCKLYVNGMSYASRTINIKSKKDTVTTTLGTGVKLPTGKYASYVSCKDSSGNIAKSSVVDFKICKNKKTCNSL